MGRTTGINQGLGKYWISFTFKYIYYLNFCISLLWFFYCHFSKQVSHETIERDSNMQHLIYFPREFYPWMVLFDWSGLFIKFYIWKYLGNYVNSLYMNLFISWIVNFIILSDQIGNLVKSFKMFKLYNLCAFYMYFIKCQNTCI